MAVKKSNLKEDNRIAALAHFSIAAFVIAGPLSICIPLLIWLLERNKTNPLEDVIFEAKQAFFYQCCIYVIAAIIGCIIAILSLIFIGKLMIPFFIIAGLLAIAYGIYGGVQTWNGKKFRYPYIARREYHRSIKTV